MAVILCLLTTLVGLTICYLDLTTLHSYFAMVMLTDVEKFSFIIALSCILIKVQRDFSRSHLVKIDGKTSTAHWVYIAIEACTMVAITVDAIFFLLNREGDENITTTYVIVQIVCWNMIWLMSLSFVYIIYLIARPQNDSQEKSFKPFLRQQK